MRRILWSVLALVLSLATPARAAVEDRPFPQETARHHKIAPELAGAHFSKLLIDREGVAYVLTDRGTWLSFKNRGDLMISVEGDQRLFNQYGVMLVNPAKHPHVKKEMGQAFVDWVISPEGQKAIAEYKIGGKQLFFPNTER